MEDAQIIELYWQRDEAAISETAHKYGAFCHRIAMNILSVREDAEECVSDTYSQVWNSIPPQRPAQFRVWLGRIVRNISINRWHHTHAQKRCAGAELLLSELEECIPTQVSVEQSLEAHELTAVIDRWLRTLPQDDRKLFLQRYWFGEPLRSLAIQRKMSPGKLAQRMFRLRKKLRAALEQEGIGL